MKKVLTILLGMVLILSMVWGVGADTEIIPDKDNPSATKTAETTVEFKVSHDYSITIPAKIGLSSSTGKGYGTIEFDVDKIGVNQYLNVVIKDSSDSYYNATSKKWKLKLDESDEGAIEYFVGVGRTVNDHIDPDSTESPLQPDYCLLSVSATQTNPHEVKIHCMIPEFNSEVLGEFAGDYIGKLTFEVSLGDKGATNTGYVFEEDYVLDKDGSTQLSYTSSTSST